MRHIQIAVIGSSGIVEYYEEARIIGAFIAENGWILINGGRDGIMEASAKGAAEKGGIVIGIHPGDSLDEANPYCTAVIPTGMGFARNAVNILSADVVVAISGGFGTLTELAYAMLYGKPIVCCTFTGGWSEEFCQSRKVAPSGNVMRAHSPEEACRLIKECVAALRHRSRDEK